MFQSAFINFFLRYVCQLLRQQETVECTVLRILMLIIETEHPKQAGDGI